MILYKNSADSLLIHTYITRRNLPNSLVFIFNRILYLITYIIFLNYLTPEKNYTVKESTFFYSILFALLLNEDNLEADKLV